MAINEEPLVDELLRQLLVAPSVSMLQAIILIRLDIRSTLNRAPSRKDVKKSSRSGIISSKVISKTRINEL